jgi:hypothetical protein
MSVNLITKPFPNKFDLSMGLNNPILEDFCINLASDIGLRDKRQFKTLILLLCNLYINSGNEVMVSRKNTPSIGKKYNPFNIGASSIRSALDALEINEYIIQKIGSYEKNKRTTMQSTNKLLKWFESKDWSEKDIEFKVGSYITLRRSKKNHNKPSYIDFKDTEYSLWLSEELKKYNQLLSKSDISILSEDGSEEAPIRKNIVRRAFIRHKVKDDIKNMEFAFGGRMYGPWIDFSEEDRKRILINGESTIELDRTASHLNAMYQVITENPCSDKDPYVLYAEGHLVPRQIAKNFCSFMQGSSSPRGTAQRVINNYKHKALEEDNPKPKDIAKYEEYLAFKKNVKPTAIVQAILMRHSKVSDKYMKGKEFGDLIGCWESDLVFEVIIELTKRGIPCLTVYDSFIVPLEYKELVDSIKDSTPYINRRSITLIDNYRR